MKRLVWLMALLLGVLMGAWAQPELRAPIAALDSLDDNDPLLGPRLAELRQRAARDSAEQLELIYRQLLHLGYLKQPGQMKAFEAELAPWRGSSEASARDLAELVVALAWSDLHTDAGNLAEAWQELDGLRLERPDALPTPWAIRWLRARAYLLESEARYAEAIPLRRELVQRQREQGELWDQVHALSRLVRVLLKSGQIAEAREAAREGVRLAEVDSETHPMQHGALSLAYMSLGQVLARDAAQGPARQAFERSLQHARAAKNRHRLADVLTEQAASHLRGGDAAQALKIGTEALTTAKGLVCEDSHAADARHVLGLARLATHQTEAGRADLKAAIDHYRTQGMLAEAAEVWSDTSRQLRQLGDGAGAEQAQREAMQLQALVERNLSRSQRLGRAPSRSLEAAAAPAPLAPAAAASAVPRRALVIGNRDYSVGALRNPLNDARAIAALLRDQSFQVQLVENLKRDDIGAVLDAFVGALQPGDDVLVFYAGHGVQVKGVNYLPAVDARIRSEGDVALNSINLNQLLERLDDRRAGVRLLLIDACRDNPYGALTRSGNVGLSRMAATPAGSLLHFATRPGSVASDGEDAHGLYTSQLLRFLREPGAPIELVLKAVSAAVRQASGGTQQPWMEGSIEGDFYLVQGHVPKRDP